MPVGIRLLRQATTLVGVTRQRPRTASEFRIGQLNAVKRALNVARVRDSRVDICLERLSMEAVERDTVWREVVQQDAVGKDAVEKSGDVRSLGTCPRRPHVVRIM